MTPKAKVVVVIPDGSLLHGVVHEVGKADPVMFSVLVLGGDVTLTFLGPPNAQGWYEGGKGYLRREYFCALLPTKSG